MNKKTFLTLLERKDLSMDEVAIMPARTRSLLGLPTIIPYTDYTPVQLFVDSYLPKFQSLRRAFGLDQELALNPIFDLGDESGGRQSTVYQRNLVLNNQRTAVYYLVEEMDQYDLIYSALDLYAEEATQADPDTQRVVWIESDDANLRQDLMDLLSRLNMEDKAFSIIRTLCKFGDDFERITTSEGLGVTSLQFIHPSRLSRVEDKRGRLQGFSAGILSPEECQWENVKDPSKVSYPWDFVHFRLMSSNRDNIHGESILMGARRAYQQLKMMEDMLVLYRMARGMDRDVYYVNTGSSTGTGAWRTLHEFRQEVRKKLGINPGTSMRQEFNIRAPDEDIFLPIAGKDDPTRIERQTGGAPQGDIDDVDHFRRKLFASLRIPAGFMGFESDTPAKATLASQDIRFARSIKRIQRAFKQGIRYICESHVASKGTETRDEVGRMILKFKVKMAAINQIEEMAKAEIYKTRMEVVTAMLSILGLQQQPDPTTGIIIPGTGIIQDIEAWTAWVLRKFLSLSDEEIGMFLGDPNIGNTSTNTELSSLTEKNLTEIAEKSGLMTRLRNKTKIIAEAVDVLRIDADEYDPSFVATERKPKKDSDGKILENQIYDLQAEENLLKESLGHVGDGPIVKCPSCSKKSLTLKRDVSESQDGLLKSRTRSYMLCRGCGYLAFMNTGD